VLTTRRRSEQTQGRLSAALHQHVVRSHALNGDAGRVFTFCECRAAGSECDSDVPLVRALPVRATIFLKEAPVLDPKPEFALPYRI
jgi:hypothetical protein